MSRSLRNEWVQWIKAIILAFIIVISLRTFVFSTSVVQGESMNPTLEDGERVLFNKFVYLTGEPLRGDIVIINRPLKNYVKRVIALPNETIEVRNHVLLIDGIPYRQNFLSDSERLFTTDFGPIKVPPYSYFVMGDNRDISKDSRNGLGFIRIEEIIGKSEFVIYPITDWSITR